MMVDSKGVRPDTKKQILIFDQDRFVYQTVRITFNNALAQGKETLFFNIPPICESDYAWYLPNTLIKDECYHYVSHKEAISTIRTAHEPSGLNKFLLILHYMHYGNTCKL